MLGGFHPGNGTPAQFESFCDSLYPHRKTVFYYLDKNEQAFQSFPADVRRIPIIARLENMPKSLPPLDLIFLDFTTNFMNDMQIQQCALSVARVLDRNGVVLATTVGPHLVGFWDDSLDGGRGRPKTMIQEYFRSGLELSKLIYHPAQRQKRYLKPVHLSRKFCTDLVVFSQLDSDFIILGRN